jgi:hypothetical protein
METEIIQTKSRNPYKPIKDALKDGRIDDVIELLSGANIKLDYGKNWLIKTSSEKGYTKLVEILLQNEEVEPTTNNNYPIRKASENGHTEVVKLLLTNKNIHMNFETTLLPALINNHIDTVEVLLCDDRMHDSDVNYKLIKYAIKNNKPNIIKVLLENKKFRLDIRNNYAIKKSTDMGHFHIIKLLLKDKKVRPQAGNNFALKSASYNRNIEVVKILLSDKRVLLKDNCIFVQMGFTNKKFALAIRWHTKILLKHKTYIRRHLFNECVMIYMLIEQINMPDCPNEIKKIIQKNLFI